MPEHRAVARLEVRFHMGPVAEEAAAMQTLGFFERLLELAGARDILARFILRSWRDEPRTVLALRWRS